MARKIRVTIDLTEDMLCHLDHWQPYGLPPGFPLPSRMDKVALAIFNAVDHHERLEHREEDFSDTIHLSEVMARHLDQWQLCPLPEGFPRPSRADKVSMAVLNAVLLYEYTAHMKQDFNDQLSRQLFRNVPPTLQDHHKRKWRMQRPSRTREDGQD